ncbi:DUF4139 domain-containing protein [Sulfitobacter sp. HNIBRBA2951]|uniref:DUF4139 domain-containing protein n=1 Tax=Sulfitobacter aquimarinus TaxID=3158557 RepID=UPI0032DF5EE4
MRLLALALTAFPLAANAEVYTLASAPTSATVYRGFAMVSRDVSVDVTAGTHEVVLADLPQWIDPARLRVAVTGADLTATRLRTDALPPAPDTDNDAVLAAKDAVKAAERALRDLDDAKQDAGLAQTAAAARLAFLQGLAESETLPSDAQALAELAQMIEAQTFTATQAQIAARRAARDVEEARPELTRALADAQAALAALTPPVEQKSLLTLSVDADAAGAVTVSVQYPANATWTPTYDVFLDRAEDDSLTLRRAALINQYTGENWEGVALTLSTLAPSGQVVPSELYPSLLRFEDKAMRAKLSAQTRSMSEDLAFAGSTEPVMEAAASPMVQFDGPGVSYVVAQPVTLAHGAEGSRIALDALSFEARVFARAVPSADTTAFLMAKATNTSAEPLLAAARAQVFVDGALVGQTAFDAVPAGDKIVQAFGPIEDLRLTRSVLDRSEGDRGLISRSNAQEQEVLMRIENLGAQSWDIELHEAIPYSEQDDLEIDWSASPTADVRDVEERRGLMQWNLELDAGETQEITIEQSIRWPDGKVLR